MFRAKKYTNRKGEEKVQVSGLQADFTKLAKQDSATVEEFNKTVSEALKS